MHKGHSAVFGPSLPSALELCRVWSSGEWDDVADVLHASDEEDEPFKA